MVIETSLPLTQALTVMAAFLALTAFTGVGASSTGGSVNNALPAVESFTNALGGSARAGDVDVFLGSVKDRNGASDVQQIRVNATGGSDPVLERSVSGDDLSTTTEPSDFDADGWKVWDSSPGDGILNFSVRFVYPNLGGTYQWFAAVKDEADWQAASAGLDVVVARAAGGGGGGGGAGQTPPEDEEADESDDDMTEVPDIDDFDATQGLSALRTGNGTELSWARVPNATGYLLWRSISPWTLLANLTADQTSYFDADSPPGARYKITFYTALSPPDGFVLSPEWLPDPVGPDHLVVYAVPDPGGVRERPEDDSTGGYSSLGSWVIAATAVLIAWNILLFARIRRPD